MRQTYFGVDSEQYIQLQDDLFEFSSLTKDLFKPSLEKEQRVALLKEKDSLKEIIQLKLSETGTILGFLNQEQTDELEAAADAIDNKDIQFLLRTNGIPKQRLEDVIAVVMNFDENIAMKNLAFFLERAKQQHLSVIVWIM
ncbi:hypothetical protein [Paenibacillus agricola]|uniref:Uncharacterized protein n=1 Tax=Paenibacillus agricola TaxID=2716264 RepID=A0ABX0JD33_9BACL|nr:hypothetical protein [Paenibacillus agricola]NHN34402.1 hypothetical protein [Paenibacillus agricola]